VADCNGDNVPYYSLIDLTGDGLPDLVVSYVCNDLMTGNDYWLVYANTGSGFATVPTQFALPPGYSAGSGRYVYSDPQDSVADCNGDNVPYYSLIDLTTTGHLDLVVSYVCASSAVGNAYWLVYPGDCP
jgi:hypothetical protein